MQETACSNTTAAAGLRTESIPLSKIPGQSRLFLQYLADPLSLRKYYPTAVLRHTQVSDRIPEILGRYKTDREELCAALEALNVGFGATAKTLENIKRLRTPDTVAVVTGQQAGLFSGPIYTIYKALSAIKMAECLRGRGFSAVPIFWAATEDHDFAEVASVDVVGKDGTVERLSYGPDKDPEGLPVGAISLDGSIRSVFTLLMGALPKTEFTSKLAASLESAYQPGDALGTAFARLICQMFGEYGLIVVDPMDARIKRLAAPMYSAAIEKSGKIVEAISERSRRLSADGFHAQVLVEQDYFPLFWHDDLGVRRSLKRAPNGEIRVSSEETVFTKNELADLASRKPERFSPGVMLRPVVQDYLFPTVCYFGGAAEIAYFAQNAAAYEILDRPVTTILDRQSFSVVESRHGRTLEKYGLEFTDLFDGFEKVLPRVVEKYLDPNNSRLFPDAEERINTELGRLDKHLSDLDPTLAKNLATRRRKISYHIAALRDKFYRARIRKDEEANRQLRAAFASLFPNGELQERSLNISMFLNLYGNYFIDWIYGSIDLDDKGHRVVYL
jgi:bacillithiol synthase